MRNVRKTPLESPASYSIKYRRGEFILCHEMKYNFSLPAFKAGNLFPACPAKFRFYRNEDGSCLSRFYRGFFVYPFGTCPFGSSFLPVRRSFCEGGSRQKNKKIFLAPYFPPVLFILQSFY
jgi:hypothetical protein